MHHDLIGGNGGASGFRPRLADGELRVSFLNAQWKIQRFCGSASPANSTRMPKVWQKNGHVREVCFGMTWKQMFPVYPLFSSNPPLKIPFDQLARSMTSFQSLMTARPATSPPLFTCNSNQPCPTAPLDRMAGALGHTVPAVGMTPMRQRTGAMIAKRGKGYVK